ncbi:MAG: nitrous oxide reductase family maturation protein NosD [Promethearchaeota archaeon]
MKSNRKTKTIVLIVLGIIFTILPLFINKTSLSVRDRDNSSNYKGNDCDNLKISAVSGKIHINNNWTATKTAGICTGNGTYADPYIIEDLVIDGGGSGNCIWIENSSVYFKIEDCTIYNSGIDWDDTCIKLQLVSNGVLFNNTANFTSTAIYLYNSDNITLTENTAKNCRWGIYLYYSDNNIISGNTVNDTWDGINLYYSDNNTISGNTANFNDNNGIELGYSNNNIISGNTVNYNLAGMHLYYSNNNTISGNTLNGNSNCWFEDDCEGNVFDNNSCRNRKIIPPVILGYNILILLGILSVVAILISKKLKKS